MSDGAALLETVAGGSIVAVRSFLRSGGLVDRRSVNLAARLGRTDMLQAFRELHGTERFFSQACENAALAGRLQTLVFLFRHDCPLSAWTFAAAVRGSDTTARAQIAQFLVSARCPFDHRTCEAAAGIGDFELLRLLVDNGHPLTATCVSNAAITGNIEIMKFLIARGCPWDARARVYLDHYMRGDFICRGQAM